MSERKRIWCAECGREIKWPLVRCHLHRQSKRLPQGWIRRQFRQIHQLVDEMAETVKPTWKLQ